MTAWLQSLSQSLTTAEGQGNLGLDPRTAADIVTKLGESNKILAQLVQTLQDLSPTATGTFTMDADSSTTVTNAAIAASSFVMIWPTNASAGTLVGAGIYWLAASGSFTVTTSSGAAAAGTETFAWGSWTTL